MCEAIKLDPSSMYLHLGILRWIALARDPGNLVMSDSTARVLHHAIRCRVSRGASKSLSHRQRIEAYKVKLGFEELSVCYP